MDAITFTPDGLLIGWAVGDGLISIDPATAESELLIQHQESFVEDMAYSKDGDTLYLTEANNLWAVNFEQETLTLMCDNLAGEAEAIETLSNDLLLLGFHNDTDSQVWLFDPQACQLLTEASLPTRYNDIEGLAVPEPCLN